MLNRMKACNHDFLVQVVLRRRFARELDKYEDIAR